MKSKNRNNYLMGLNDTTEKLYESCCLFEELQLWMIIVMHSSPLF